MRKVTIFSVSIGHGHHAASKALKEQFEQQGQHVTIVDTLQAVHPLFHKAIVDLYLLTLKKAPRVWRGLYHYSSRAPHYLLTDWIIRLASRKLKLLISTNESTILISTHPFATAILANLKRKKITNLPIYTVITDLCFHPAYLRTGVDGYFAAFSDSKEIKAQMKDSCKPIFCTGIPITHVPTILAPRSEIRKKLQLNHSKRTVLLAGGGLGLLNYVEVIRSLEKIPESIQILCMIGENKKVMKDVEQVMSKHEVVTIPYTEKFIEYVRASDVILSKAGGLTMSEALACETPVIIYQSVPGHEEENAQYLTELGTAVKVNTINELSDNVYMLLFNESVHSSLVFNARKHKRPEAAKEIVQVINQLSLSSFT
ncbi:MGDG synthase family glycosyltransferase [Bacillus sp. FJAT-45037]|uniref:MGDG synthase family glycosyltransferase n=1 Tax=Bacillus sp. FJAT-45037 TaxID=2011007 RepID=UPI000C234E60|nr:glycosyltransferase [Bacillus sp. FJAT-45037]